MKKYQVELLAPAGNMDAFLGAIHAGADAVYLGGNKYGARAYADNFTTEELIFCIRYAHIWGRKVYLTVNTLMKDSEIKELDEYIRPLYEAGLDACIVQDFGAFVYLKRYFPDMELHASTQMTITGAHGAQLLKDMGATRIVPARELSLEEIKHIKEQTGLELETFIHGAMCYCYSGQCLFSSILGGRSGNRGRCAQPCRLPYQVTLPEDTSEKTAKPTHRSYDISGEYYPLSLKDMCTLEHIEALMDAGIDSFKIEGRMKKPEYAAGVTAIYRKYIDLKKKNPDKPLQFMYEDLDKLSKLYIRSERQDGYYFKQNGADMITLTNPAYSGNDEELLKEIRSSYLETKPKLAISMYATFILDEKVSLTCIYNNLSVTVEGDMAEEAKNMPLLQESIEKQLKKLGDTCFEAESIEIYTDERCFYSVKALNELRRKAIAILEEKIIRSHGLCAGRILFDDSEDITCNTDVSATTEEASGWTVVISSEEQLAALSNSSKFNECITIHRVYLESELLLKATRDKREVIYNSYLTTIKETNPKTSFYIALPYVIRHKDTNRLKRLMELSDLEAYKGLFKGFLIRNIEEYALLEEMGYMGEIRCDAGIYIWNRESLHFWKERVDGLHCPIELNKKEWKHLFNDDNFEKLVYGRIPMMVTANCVAKTTVGCRHGENTSTAYLNDRYNKQFPVKTICEYCMNVVYNSVPVSLHKDVSVSLHEYDKKLQFTVENREETIRILNFFKKIAAGQLTEPPFKDYTTGHEKRGVL